MRIGDFEIGSKCFIVAELSGNHGGSVDRAKDMIDVAILCGADAVKTQTYTMEDMPDRFDKVKGCGKWDGMRWWEVYERVMLSEDEQLELRDYAKGKIIFFSTVCSKEAVDFWEENGGLPAYKIAVWQGNDRDLVLHVLAKDKPVIITGAYWPVRGVLHLVRDNLDHLAKSIDLHHIPLGFSNHGPIENCIEAVKRGAVIVEQHLTLSRDTIDGQFAALPAEFGYMVREVRNWEKKQCKSS